MRFFVFSSILLLAITGCKPIWDPSFIPSGYSYHHNETKSPPGPEAESIGYEFSIARNEQIIEQWRIAVADLVERATSQGLDLTGPLHLRTDLKESALQATFDSTLRDELRSRGIIVTDKTEMSSPLFYSAYDPDLKGHIKTAPDRLYNDDLEDPYEYANFLPDSKNMELVIGIISKGRLTHKASIINELPIYGFLRSGYNPGPVGSYTYNGPLSVEDENEEGMTP